MTYDVLKEFTDPAFKIPDAEAPEGPKVALHLVPGEPFIPAKYNYGTDRTAKLVADGVLKLREKSATEAVTEKAPAKKK